MMKLTEVVKIAEAGGPKKSVQLSQDELALLVMLLQSDVDLPSHFSHLSKDDLMNRLMAQQDENPGTV